MTLQEMKNLVPRDVVWMQSGFTNHPLIAEFRGCKSEYEFELLYPNHTKTGWLVWIPEEDHAMLELKTPRDQRGESDLYRESRALRESIWLKSVLGAIREATGLELIELEPMRVSGTWGLRYELRSPTGFAVWSFMIVNHEGSWEGVREFESPQDALEKLLEKKFLL